MGKLYFAFAWDKIVNLHVCICKNKICIWSDPGVSHMLIYSGVYLRSHELFAYPELNLHTGAHVYLHALTFAHANWT